MRFLPPALPHALPKAVLIAVGLLSACSKPAPTDPATDPSADNGAVVVNTALFSADPAPARAVLPDYTGRWTGVEGMYLVVAKDKTPGSYTLEMQYDLDHKATTTGRAQGDTIVFTRDGKPEALKPTDGNGTGLKYLVGKKECLRVKDGEGYCRE